MCWFLAVAAPPPVMAVFVRSLGQRLATVAATDPRLQQAIGRGLDVCYVLRGGCSCRLVRDANAREPEHLRQRLARKGWSAAKIERAVADKAGGTGNSPFRGDIAQALREALAVGAPVRVALTWGHDGWPAPAGAVVVRELDDAAGLPADAIVELHAAASVRGAVTSSQASSE